MKTIKLMDVKEKVKETVQTANFNLNPDLKARVEESLQEEVSTSGKEILGQILKNADVAKNELLALCQDTGLAVFFVEIGEQVQLEYDGFKSMKDAITQGAKEGYEEGYLRKSVCDPITRKNTGDNTPVFIHWEMVEGDTFKMTFMAKGGGSENMSALKMMAPSAGAQGIEDFVEEVKDWPVDGLAFTFYVPRIADDSGFAWEDLRERDDVIRRTIAVKQAYPNLVKANVGALELMLSDCCIQSTGERGEHCGMRGVLPLYMGDDEGGSFERTFCCYGNDVDCTRCGAYSVFNTAYQRGVRGDGEYHHRMTALERRKSG